MQSTFKTCFTLAAGMAIGAATVGTLKAQIKPPVYTISIVDVTDAEGYAKNYAPAAVASIKAAGGKFLGASAKPIVLLGDAPKGRVTMSQWESAEKAAAWRDQADVKKLREDAAKYAKFVSSWIVDGAPQYRRAAFGQARSACPFVHRAGIR